MPACENNWWIAANLLTEDSPPLDVSTDSSNEGTERGVLHITREEEGTMVGTAKLVPLEQGMTPSRPITY